MEYVLENPFAMLMDTGTGCFIMSKSIFDSIPEINRPKLVNKNRNIR